MRQPRRQRRRLGRAPRHRPGTTAGSARCPLFHVGGLAILAARARSRRPPPCCTTASTPSGSWPSWRRARSPSSRWCPPCSAACAMPGLGATPGLRAHPARRRARFPPGLLDVGRAPRASPCAPTYGMTETASQIVATAEPCGARAGPRRGRGAARRRGRRDPRARADGAPASRWPKTAGCTPATRARSTRRPPARRRPAQGRDRDRRRERVAGRGGGGAAGPPGRGRRRRCGARPTRSGGRRWRRSWSWRGRPRAS